MSNATTYQITILSYCIFNVMFFSYQALSSWLWSLGKIVLEDLLPRWP